MQLRLQDGFIVDDFSPSTIDFPEKLTLAEFRRDFGGVGSPRYRQGVRKIERRLNGYVALSIY